MSYPFKKGHCDECGTDFKGYWKEGECNICETRKEVWTCIRCGFVMATWQERGGISHGNYSVYYCKPCFIEYEKEYKESVKK